MMDEADEDEPSSGWLVDEPSSGWLVAVAIVLASVTFGSLVAWIVKVAGG